ncbi:MAG: PepSY-associated TM helix domain-containing protein [Pseudomonadota bacterium]
MASLGSDKIKRLVALHGWSGTLLSILLYVVMLTGTVIVFDNEIRRWSQGAAPEVALSDLHLDTRLRHIAGSIPPRYLEEIQIGRSADGSPRLTFTAHGAEDRSIVVTLGPDGAEQSRREGPTGALRLSEPGTAYERFLVDFHVRLHIPEPWGLYLTGLLGFAMLLAAISGVLIHRHILRDAFVTTRPGGRVVSDRDRHTLAGVWGLPFATLLAFTGAFLSFATSLGLPVVAMVAFGGDQERALQAVLGEEPEISEEYRSLAVLDDVIATATTLNGSVPGALLIHGYGRQNAEIESFHPPHSGALSGQTLVFDGTTGAFLRAPVLVGTEPSLGSTLVDLVAPLHFGTFAGLLSRAIWAGLGAAMTFSIVSGMQLWLRRRMDDPVWRSCRLALASVVWGLPLSLVTAGMGFFLAEPFGHGFAGCVWGSVLGALAVVAHGLWRARADETLRAQDLRLALALGLLCLPLLRMITGGPGWIDGIWHADPVVAGIDLTCLSLALCAGFTPYAARRADLHSMGSQLWQARAIFRKAP